MEAATHPSRALTVPTAPPARLRTACRHRTIPIVRLRHQAPATHQSQVVGEITRPAQVIETTTHRSRVVAVITHPAQVVEITTLLSQVVVVITHPAQVVEITPHLIPAGVVATHRATQPTVLLHLEMFPLYQVLTTLRRAVIALHQSPAGEEATRQVRVGEMPLHAMVPTRMETADLH